MPTLSSLMGPDIVVNDKVCIMTAWCQLCWQWWHRRLSLWQTVVPLMTIELALWKFPVSRVRMFLAATKQLYEWSSPSVHPAGRPSVTPFSPCSHHRIIIKFPGVITNARNDDHAKGQSQRSNKGQGHRGKNTILQFSDCNARFNSPMSTKRCTKLHSGETDEANCSWLHPVWPPPKRPDQDSTFCVVSRASTDLIFCIHRDFDVRNKVYKPRRLVCECCRDISAWKLRVMKPTVLRDPGRMRPTEYRDEANWFSNWTDEANCW